MRLLRGLSFGAAFSILMPWTASASSTEASVREFIGRSYFHGVKYEEARALGPEALPHLESMLADPGMKLKWRSIIATIAYIGSPRSFAILRSFMWDRFKGQVDNETWKALLAVPNVMGTIPDTPQSPVIDYLEKGANPSFWKDLPWTEKYHQQAGDLGIVLSQVSINGLSCTGTERAARVLERLSERPHSKRQIPNIKDGIEINKMIRARGFEGYLKHVQESAGATIKGGKAK